MTAPALQVTAVLCRLREFASWSLASACWPRSYIVDRTLCDSIDLDDLRSRAVSGDNSNRLPADREDGRQELNQRGIRRTVDGRGREADFQCVAVHAGGFIVRRTGLHA